MIKTNLELVDMLKSITANYKTLYIKGCFGAPMTASNKKRYIADYAYNSTAERAAMINAASEDTFGFDCICLIKGILWGWSGDKTKVYGGAVYASAGVPDIGEDTMITKCNGVSTTGWNDMLLGEVVWMKGHIGVYIGDGKVIECSPSYKNRVQETACLNIGTIAGMAGRKWTKHGKLPYITYVESTGSTGGVTAQAQPSVPVTNNFKIGDIVNFTGNRQYASANASSGSTTKAGPAKITVISSGAKHPYHVIHIDSTSTVYGWVDAADISSDSVITYHKVVKGDTLSAIASKYGTTVDKLVTANRSQYPKITTNYIVIGWMLIIP